MKHISHIQMKKKEKEDIYEPNDEVICQITKYLNRNIV